MCGTPQQPMPPVHTDQITAFASAFFVDEKALGILRFLLLLLIITEIWSKAETQNQCYKLH